MTTTISSRGQTVIPAEIRARHHLTEQSRLAWIDDGQTIRVVPLAAGANKYGRGIAKDLDLARALVVATAQRFGALLIHKDPEFESLKSVIRLKALPYKARG